MENKMKHLEIKTIETNGIKVMVKIDYDKGEISLVEKNPSDNKFHEVKFESKRWIFANRTIDYMDSWVNIFEAMAEAVKVAKKQLREFQKIKESEMVGVLNKAMNLIDKESKKLGKKYTDK